MKNGYYELIGSKEQRSGADHYDSHYNRNSCDGCDEVYGHKIDCKNLTIENLRFIAMKAQERQKIESKVRDRYFRQLQAMCGKAAILKNENNKLRKRNEELINYLASHCTSEEWKSFSSKEQKAVRKKSKDKDAFEWFFEAFSRAKEAVKSVK